MFTQNIGADNL